LHPERPIQNCNVLLEWFKSSHIPLEMFAVLYVLSLVIPALAWMGLGVFVPLEKTKLAVGRGLWFVFFNRLVFRSMNYCALNPCGILGAVSWVIELW
jgi:hypothetical protein